MSHYASMLQKAAMKYAQMGFGSRFKTYRNTPALQVQPGDLPMLAIYIMRERRTPWGHANHGAPKFQHELTMGFSGAVHAETDNQNALLTLEETMSQLDVVLLSNPKFVNVTAGIEAMDRQSQYAKVGETTLYEIRVEMVVAWQSDYPPIVEDWLERVHVTTEFPDKAHAESGTPQIIREYDLETE